MKYLKYLWLIELPLLFLPDLGFERITPFGTLTLADSLMVPYLVSISLLLTKQNLRMRLLVDDLIPLMVIFIYWATLSTLTINFRYGYNDLFHIVYGLLKLGKLCLYGYAGILTIRVISYHKMEKKFYWSLIAAGGLVGTVLIISTNNTVIYSSIDTIIEQAYFDNMISSIMALLICCVSGLLLNQENSAKWNKAAIICLVIMVMGFVLARGRGGWIGALVGLLFLMFQFGLKRVLILGLVISSLVTLAYIQIPAFQAEIEKTLHPDAEYLDQYNLGFAGFDDGKRITIWINEGSQFFNTPQESLIGRGFLHRGDLSGLHPSGSHNFFIQMFLETGVVGGVIILLIFIRMWHHSTSILGSSSFSKLPSQAALITAIVIGFSGEYYYGGMALFTLMLVYSSAGSISVSHFATYSSLTNAPRVTIASSVLYSQPLERIEESRL